MKRKFIPAAESFAHWKKDPKFVEAYNAIEAEFALASSRINARLETGKVMPSTQHPTTR